MTQSDIINNNFSKAFECIKCSNAYDTGAVLSEEKLFKQISERKRSTFDLSKFTVVGSPTITDDGIASGFSNGNYLTIPYDWAENVTNFKITGKFKVENSVQGSNSILGYVTDGYSMGLSFNSTSINWFAIKTSSEDVNLYQGYSITPDIDYSYELQLNNNLYTFRLFDDTGSAVVNLSKSTNSPFSIASNYLRLGASGNYNPLDFMTGSIDLKQFSITVDGKEVFSGNPTALDTIKANNYTVQGSPTITDDGMFKANATGDYIQKSGFTNEIKKELRCDGRYYYSTKTNNTGSVIQLANGSTVYWDINSDGLVTLTDDVNVSTVQIEIPLKDGDIFDTEIIYNASTITLNVCLNEGVNYTTSIASQGLTTFNTWNLTAEETYWGGTIDLNTIHVYIDGNLVYQPCLKIPYTITKTGSKIVDAAYRLRVEDCYNQYGSGNYYLFSNATEQFALPMPDIYGIIESLKLNITAIEGTNW